MQTRNALRVYLFDLDGTVADTHGLIMQCYDHAAQTHLGQAGRREIWELNIGLPLDEILRATYTHYKLPEPTQAQIDAMKQTYRAHMRDNDNTIRPFAGIPETLTELKQRGLRLGIVTTKHQAMALRHLELLELRPLFEANAIICGDMCARYKPAPDPFLRALDELNATPEETAMIGDSQHDIAGAKSVGILAVAACWGTDHRADLLAAQPDVIIERPPDLLSLIV